MQNCFFRAELEKWMGIFMNSIELGPWGLGLIQDKKVRSEVK
jgi:hypothetical protein